MALAGPKLPKQGHKYRLKFLPSALDEWRALDGSVKEHFRKREDSAAYAVAIARLRQSSGQGAKPSDSRSEGSAKAKGKARGRRGR